MLVKGIKKGKIIELLEEVNSPENQEILISIKEVRFCTDTIYYNFYMKLRIL